MVATLKKIWNKNWNVEKSCQWKGIDNFRQIFCSKQTLLHLSTFLEVKFIFCATENLDRTAMNASTSLHFSWKLIYSNGRVSDRAKVHSTSHLIFQCATRALQIFNSKLKMQHASFISSCLKTKHTSIIEKFASNSTVFTFDCQHRSASGFSHKCYL